MPRRKPKSSPAEKESSSKPGQSHLQEEKRKQSAVNAVKDSPDGASFSGHSDPEKPPPTVKRLKEEKEPEKELPIRKKPRGKQKVEAKEELEEKEVAEKEEPHPAEESGGELPVKKRPRGKQQKVEAKEELGETEESHSAATQKPATKKGKSKAVTKSPDPEDGEKKGQGDAMEALPQKQYWLMKSEPESRMQKGVDVKFSIEDLQNEPDQTTCWDGVRNYQGRNIMRDKMRVGDQAFFYHSNCKDPGIVGIMEVVREGYVDPTQFDKSDPHFDPSSKPEEPKWFAVDVKFVRLLKRFVSLAELRLLFREHGKTGGALAGMALFTQGRLSVQPVTKEQFDFILSLEAEKP